MNRDMEWKYLGDELCELIHILLSKRFGSIISNVKRVRYYLDNIVCAEYSRNVHYLPVDNQISISQIFYGCRCVFVKDESKLIKENIIKRLKEVIHLTTNMLDTIPEAETHEEQLRRIRMKDNIKEVRKNLVKMSEKISKLEN